MSVEVFHFSAAKSTDLALSRLCVVVCMFAIARKMLLNSSTILLTKGKAKKECLLKVNLSAEHLCAALKAAFEIRPGCRLSALGRRSMR
jgi:hypothetical protein